MTILLAYLATIDLPFLFFRGLSFPLIRINHLNTQFHLDTFANSFLKFLVRQSRLDPVLHECVHLLWGATHEARWIQEIVELSLDRVKVRIVADPINKIVLKTKLFDLMRGFMGQNLDRYTVYKHIAKEIK